MNVSCTENSKCTNTEGSFYCMCNPGYFFGEEQTCRGNKILCPFVGNYNFFPVQTKMSVNVVWTTVTKMLTVLIQKAVTCAHAEKVTVVMEDIALVSFVL